LNAGSSSLKFSVYRDVTRLNKIVSGQIENIGQQAIFSSTQLAGKRSLGEVTIAQGLLAICQHLQNDLRLEQPIGVGHRVVHGGSQFVEPCKIGARELNQLEKLNPLAPLHQPHNLNMLKLAKKQYPHAQQVACFDTAFHHSHAWVNDTFAIPRHYYEQGIRRYGFHGLAYQHIADVLPQVLPEHAHKRVIVAHLGNGASMCAIEGGKSAGSTMGFSAIDGLPMGTRSGQLDPGVILHWLNQGMNAADIEDILYKRSGLKGLSMISSDVRDLINSKAESAVQALDYFASRAKREIGGLASIMGGVDAFVFSGGIGENSAQMRQKIMHNMAFLNLSIDVNKNNHTNSGRIDASGIPICIIPADEEIVIAKAVAQLVA
jgi:acetate kinase